MFLLKSAIFVQKMGKNIQGYREYEGFLITKMTIVVTEHKNSTKKGEQTLSLNLSYLGISLPGLAYP